MTQTTTNTTETATVPNPHPSDILMNLIATFLAPMFLGVTGGDIGLARMAATETVNAYRAQNLADLIAIAQIIAYGLAALGSLSLSMADEISLSMTLRLRANANACSRSAEQNRRALSQCFGDNAIPYRTTAAAKPETPPPIPADRTPTKAEVFLNDAAANMLAAESEARLRDPEPAVAQTQLPTSARALAPTTTSTQAEKRNQEMWAIVMAKKAGDLTASIPNLPQAERKAASIRAAALSSTAHQLLTGGGSHAQSSSIPIGSNPATNRPGRP